MGAARKLKRKTIRISARRYDVREWKTKKHHQFHINVLIASKIRALLVAHDITQTELGIAMRPRMSGPAVCYWLNGSRNLDNDLRDEAFEAVDRITKRRGPNWER